MLEGVEMTEHARALVEKRIGWEEYRRRKADYWAERGRCLLPDGSLYSRALVDEGVVFVHRSPALRKEYAAVAAYEREVPDPDKPGKFKKVQVVDERLWNDAEEEERRIDAAIKAASYTSHVADYMDRF